MQRCSLSALMMLIALAGCPGGSGGIGDSCGGNGDCDGTLQCLSSKCVPRCQRAPECGDGYSCDAAGLCQLAKGEAGDACTSEVDCAAGLSCQIDGASVDANGHLLASCTAENFGSPAGSACDDDSECRNGTCALGHCVDLCDETRDCGTGNSCAIIPSVKANGALFAGCLPSQGSLTWSIPALAPSAEVLLPVPDVARSASLIMSVDDLNQKVGASSVLSPAGVRIYTKPCVAPVFPTDPPCSDDDMLDQYFGDATSAIRHLPEAGQSVLAMPSNPSVALETGAYRVRVSSFRANGTVGSSIPHVTAVVKLDSGVLLDLHFFFLNLDDHLCMEKTDGARLDAVAAQSSTYFQGSFLGELRSELAHAGLAVGEQTYEDIRDHADLDGLDVADAGSLLALGKYDTGINVFFVRTLSPVGLQAFGPNPGPAGLASTRQSGIIVGLDTLCYRDWERIARLTTHEIARYMGLYHNVELEVLDHPLWRDPISDSDDSSGNLMFYSEFGMSDLSPGQREILSRSAVLR